jgi:glycosyltransferase involved in cell wall biosynthesis
VAAINTNDLHSRLQRLQANVSVRIERRLIRHAKIVTAVSPSMAADLRHYGLAPEKIEILDNAIDPETFRPGPGPRDGPLLYTGRLAPRKGLPELLRAIALLRRRGRDVPVDITGRGPFRDILERLAREEGIADLVRFKGFVSREELRGLLQATRLYVFPSFYEGLPTSLLEAMGCGAPIVATRAPGVVDLIADGANGRLVPVGDAAAIADAVAGALDHPEEARAWGAQARKDVEERYSWERVASRAERLYARLVA